MKCKFKIVKNENSSQNKSRLLHIFTIRSSFLDVCHELEILESINPVDHVALFMLIVDN